MLAKTKIGKYIEDKMKERGIESFRKLSVMADVSNAEISRILNGERKYPNPNILQKLAIALNASYEDMLDLAGYLSRNKIKTSLPEGIDPAKNIVLLPVLGVIRAGQPLYAEENVIGYEPINPEFIIAGEYFFLLVAGDSMTGSGIKDGSFVLVRKQEEINDGEVAVVMVDEENATVRRLFFDDKLNLVILQPDNPHFAPKTCYAENVQIIGKVMRAIIDPNKRK